MTPKKTASNETPAPVVELVQDDTEKPTEEEVHRIVQLIEAAKTKSPRYRKLLIAAAVAATVVVVGATLLSTPNREDEERDESNEDSSEY